MPKVIILKIAIEYSKWRMLMLDKVNVFNFVLYLLWGSETVMMFENRINLIFAIQL